MLAAGGQLAIGAEINADGFAGGPDDAGAGGGGGSGGVILLRGAGDIDVTMKPGLNEVCIHVVDDANAALPEAKSCTPIAYIPE